MYRLSRLALALACPLLVITRQSGWGGRWIILPIVAFGVGAVILMLYERRLKGADDPTVLDLQG